MNIEIIELVTKYIESNGEKALVEILDSKNILPDDGILTIIANGGIHPLNELHKRGDVFFASEGNLNFTSREFAELELAAALKRVANKLQSRSWKKVYLVPFGPSVLSTLIKSMVYKVLHIETIDVLHAGNGVHFDIDLDLRRIAVE